MKNALSVCFLLLLFGCGQEQQSTEQPEQINLKISEAASYNPSIKEIKLETNNSCLIGDITQMEGYKDRIYILDDSRKGNCVLVFDTTGRFVSSFVQIGRGPQEVVKPTSFVIKNDTLIVVDANLLQTKHYNLTDHKYIGSKDIGFNTTQLLYTPSGKLLFNYDEYDKSKPHNDKLYVLTDDQYNIIEGFVDRAVYSGYQMTYGFQMYDFQGQTRTFSSYDPHIWTVDGQDKAKPVYRITFDRYGLPPVEFVNKALAEDRFFDAIRNSDYVSSYGVVETEHEICIPFFVHKVPYVGFYSKRDKSAVALSKEKFATVSGIDLSYIAGVLGDYFVTPVAHSESQNPTLLLFNSH